VNKQKITLKQVDETGELILYKEKSAAEEIKKKLSLIFQLTGQKEEKKFILPKPPLITSLLLFEAKSQLGFSVAQTTQLAQKLYEGGAHESIHPTYLDYQPEEIKSSLTEEEYKLYKLIYNHTLASLMMAPEVYFPNYNVKLKSELIALWSPAVPGISQLEAYKIEVQEYQENKPVRYNEGSLVQELEKLGIGRPSTYNLFGRVLLKRGYAKLNEKGQFIPTPLGIA
ncbi:7247_t:CDS:2, partial [Racocetra persica]